MRFIFVLCILISTASCALHASTNPGTDNEPVASKADSIAAGHVNDSLSTLVRGFYKGKNLEPFWSDDPNQRSILLSDHLAGLFTSNQNKFGQLTITFDPIVNGQDALIPNLVVYPALFDGNRAHVHVRFRNFDTDNALVYSFAREGGDWKLDEIAAVGGDTRWLLTDVIRNP